MYIYIYIYIYIYFADILRCIANRTMHRTAVWWIHKIWVMSPMRIPSDSLFYVGYTMLDLLILVLHLGNVIYCPWHIGFIMGFIIIIDPGIVILNNNVIRCNIAVTVPVLPLYIIISCIACTVSGLVINLLRARTELFWFSIVDIIVADSLAPRVTRTSSTMVLTIWNG